jgi:hypothetical protein
MEMGLRCSCQKKTVGVSSSTLTVEEGSYGSKSQRHVYCDEHADGSVATFVEKLYLVGNHVLQVVDLFHQLVQLPGEICEIVNASLSVQWFGSA